MVEIKNKFVSWTLNVVKERLEVESSKQLYGVGVSLAVEDAALGNTSAADKAVACGGKTTSTTANSGNKGRRIVVSAIDPAGPASRAGLKVNDVILAVDTNRFDDGKSTPEDVAKLIRGPERSNVGVLVERGGMDGGVLEFRLQRERIGTIAQFDAKTPKADIVKDVLSEPAKTLVDEDELALEVEENASSKEAKAACVKESIKDVDAKVKNTEKNIEPIKQFQSRPLSTTEALNDYLTKSYTESKPLKTHELSSSKEEATDKFITEHFYPSPPALPTRKSLNSIEDHSEEKTLDNNESCSIINSVDGENNWELLSEKSGSAVLISFSGSVSNSWTFRSASPSMLSNKFVLAESTGEQYMEHVVLPTDTLQGLCLAYKISATRLRMENSFSGNSLQMAPKKLRIPTHITTPGIMIRTQDKSSKEYKLYAFCAETNMELVEAKAYLDLSNWDLEEAVRSAKEDDGWNLRGVDDGDGVDGGAMYSPIIAAVKPKALTAQDIYAVSE